MRKSDLPHISLNKKQMINSVTISPVETGNHSTMIDGKYHDNTSGQDIVLLTNWGYAINRVLTSNEQKWIEWFKPNKTSVSFTWDDSTDLGKKIAKWIEYLKRHEGIKCEGNDNAVKNPQFKLVDSRQKHIETATDINLKLEVGNLILEMKTSEMMQVAYLVNANPVGKTTEQIFSELCDFDLGKCMVNASRFLKEWEMADRSHVVYARKAISLGIISTDNGIYKLNNTTIGGGIDDVVLYFKNNPETYTNFIKKEVDAKDKLPVSVSEDVLVSSIISKTKKVEPKMPNNRKDSAEVANNRAERKGNEQQLEDKRQELIGQLKRLGVKGAQLADRGNWSIEKIETKIAEALKEKELQPA